MMHRILASLLLLRQISSFSAPPEGEGAFALFDRFRPSCPTDIGAIRRYDASLVGNDHPAATWVAVYRSANNKPSVFVKDEFLNAMRVATNVATDAASRSEPNIGIEKTEESLMEATATPVAVARLTPSLDFDDCWLVDNMRCMLKKEDTNPDCDGGSEHMEALSVAIDSVLIHHLTQRKDAPFDGAIRTKATIVSGPLLEQRGFREVTSLSRDMCSHVCDLDACMDSYASRAISTVAKGPGARERAVQICSLLGRIDREKDLKASADAAKANGEGDDDDYDPWATKKNQLF
jgi:hypothetical protein